MWSLAKLIQPGARNESISWVLKSARGLKSEPSGFGSWSSSTLVGSGRNHPGGNAPVVAHPTNLQLPLALHRCVLGQGVHGEWG
jgi:hypothetical protein